MSASPATHERAAAAHTPGPWEVGYALWSEDGNVMYELIGVKTASALDARLIAAAPDLLAALRELSTMYAHTWDKANGDLLMMKNSIPRFEAAHAKAVEAIEKATSK